MLIVMMVAERTEARVATITTINVGGASASRLAVRLGPFFPTAESTGLAPNANLKMWSGPLSTSSNPAPTETINGMTCQVFDGYLVSLSGGSYLHVDSPCVVFRHSRFVTSGVVSNSSAMVQQAAGNSYIGCDWCEFDGGPAHQHAVCRATVPTWW